MVLFPVPPRADAPAAPFRVGLAEKEVRAKHSHCRSDPQPRFFLFET